MEREVLDQKGEAPLSRFLQNRQLPEKVVPQHPAFMLQVTYTHIKKTFSLPISQIKYHYLHM